MSLESEHLSHRRSLPQPRSTSQNLHKRVSRWQAILSATRALVASSASPCGYKTAQKQTHRPDILLGGCERRTRSFPRCGGNGVRRKAVLGILLLVLVVGLSDCGGDDSLPTPSAVQPRAVVPPVPPPGTDWLAGYALTEVSLFGTVYESTVTGPMSIAGALVYCELCGKVTHSWATADANGFYSFSGDLASGGGIWLAAGQRITVYVQADGYRDPSGSLGERYVSIVGDTRLDLELVRR
jgi:hypothetical protein